MEINMTTNLPATLSATTDSPAPPRPLIRPRITVVENVYHQLGNESPKQPVTTRFYRWLETDEQVYTRKLKVGEQWQKLDTGWLEEVGLLIVANEAEKLQTIPSTQERELAAAKVLELSYGETAENAWFVYPGESMRGVPAAPKDLRIRCRSGVTLCTITAFPK